MSSSPKRLTRETIEAPSPTCPTIFSLPPASRQTRTRLPADGRRIPPICGSGSKVRAISFSRWPLCRRHASALVPSGFAGADRSAIRVSLPGQLHDFFQKLVRRSAPTAVMMSILLSSPTCRVRTFEPRTRPASRATATTARSGAICAIGFRIRTREDDAAWLHRVHSREESVSQLRDRRRGRSSRRAEPARRAGHRTDRRRDRLLDRRIVLGTRHHDGRGRPVDRLRVRARSRSSGCSRFRSRPTSASCRVLEKVGYVREGLHAAERDQGRADP